MIMIVKKIKTNFLFLGILIMSLCCACSAKNTKNDAKAYNAMQSMNTSIWQTEPVANEYNKGRKQYRFVDYERGRQFSREDLLDLSKGFWEDDRITIHHILRYYLVEFENNIRGDGRISSKSYKLKKHFFKTFIQQYWMKIALPLITGNMDKGTNLKNMLDKIWMISLAKLFESNDLDIKQGISDYRDTFVKTLQIQDPDDKEYYREIPISARAFNDYENTSDSIEKGEIIISGEMWKRAPKEPMKKRKSQEEDIKEATQSSEEEFEAETCVLNVLPDEKINYEKHKFECIKKDKKDKMPIPIKNIIRIRTNVDNNTKIDGCGWTSISSDIHDLVQGTNLVLNKAGLKGVEILESKINDKTPFGSKDNYIDFFNQLTKLSETKTDTSDIYLNIKDYSYNQYNYCYIDDLVLNNNMLCFDKKEEMNDMLEVDSKSVSVSADELLSIIPVYGSVEKKGTETKGTSREHSNTFYINVDTTLRDIIKGEEEGEEPKKYCFTSIEYYQIIKAIKLFLKHNIKNISKKKYKIWDLESLIRKVFFDNPKLNNKITAYYYKHDEMDDNENHINTPGSMFNSSHLSYLMKKLVSYKGKKQLEEDEKEAKKLDKDTSGSNMYNKIKKLRSPFAGAVSIKKIQKDKDLYGIFNIIKNSFIAELNSIDDKMLKKWKKEEEERKNQKKEKFIWVKTATPHKPKFSENIENIDIKKIRRNIKSYIGKNNKGLNEKLTEHILDSVKLLNKEQLSALFENKSPSSDFSKNKPYMNKGLYKDLENDEAKGIDYGFYDDEYKKIKIKIDSDNNNNNNPKSKSKASQPTVYSSGETTKDIDNNKFSCNLVYKILACINI